LTKFTDAEEARRGTGLFNTLKRKPVVEEAPPVPPAPVLAGGTDVQSSPLIPAPDPFDDGPEYEAVEMLMARESQDACFVDRAGMGRCLPWAYMQSWTYEPNYTFIALTWPSHIVEIEGENLRPLMISCIAPAA
jgi:hypothetical protein